MSLPYATPEAIQRKLDLPLDQLDTDQRRRYRARASAASDEWDKTTSNPMRSRREGRTEEPSTWAYHSARNRGSPPIVVVLDHSHIQPIDRAAGDRVEIRTGRDSWDDVTDEAGDEFAMLHERGDLKIFRFLINRVYYEPRDERFIRLTYRHGGLGGNRNRGAETTTDGSVSQGDTTISVTSAGRFPDPPFIADLGAPTEHERVRVIGVDRGADDLTVERGVRGTDDVSHTDGDTVQYSPDDVREAVAARAAELLTLDDDARPSIPNDGQMSSRSTRADRFHREWQDALGRYSEVMAL
jgi:hypothetical protein